MALPVVTVASGGLPVVDMTAAAPTRGLPITEVASRGMAVTKVSGTLGLPVTYVTADGQVVPPIVLTAFDPATVSNTALSNGNLTATHTNTTANAGARSIAYKTSGKYYFEITPITGHGTFDFMGLIKSTGAYVDLLGGTNTTSISRSGGSINSNGGGTGIVMGAFADGAPVGVAVDLTARLAWFRRGVVWNAGGAANPTTGVGGVIVEAGSFAPVVTFAGSGTAANDAYTLNLGATAFANAAPAGFGGWPV